MELGAAVIVTSRGEGCRSPIDGVTGTQRGGAGVSPMKGPVMSSSAFGKVTCVFIRENKDVLEKYHRYIIFSCHFKLIS